MPTIEQRLAYLESKLAALEEESSETLQPNYLTYNPATGIVGANFSGVINAQGLILPAGLTDISKIEWQRVADALVASYIQANSPAANRAQLNMFAQNPDDGGNSFARLLAVVDATIAGNTHVSATAQSTAGGVHGTGEKIIIDDLSRSDFLQLGAPNLSAVGISNLTWPAASAFSNVLNVGLPGATGTVKAIAVASGNINNPGFFDQGVVTTFSPGGGVFQLQAKSAGGGAPGATGTMSVSWLAYGA